MERSVSLICLFVCSLQPLLAQEYTLKIEEQSIHSSMRGIACNDQGLVWVSGSNGTIGHSDDHGTNWQFFVIPGMENASFRDIDICADGSVVVMSATQPAALLRSTDGGLHFDMTFSQSDSIWFLDGFDMDDSGWGLCYGDPQDGRMTLLETNDFGKTWKILSNGPMVSEGTAAFAASGTGIQVVNRKTAYFITGGAASDLYRTRDRGKTWQKVSSTGLPPGQTSGANGLFIDGRYIYVVGGDFNHETDTAGVFLYSENRGRSWKTAAISPSGYRSAVAVSGKLIAVCGITGVDLADRRSPIRFTHRSDAPIHTLTSCGDVIYMAGPDGRTGVVFDTK